MNEAANGGLANARDVGGLRLTNGGQVRSGVLYRSDGPMTGDPAPALQPWPPTTVIDLREAAELASGHPLEAAGVVVHSLPLLAAAGPAQLTAVPPAELDLASLYTAMVETGGDKVVQIARLVAASDGPCLVHCAVGKDRTGVAVAIMLSAVGVMREDIVTDYEVTTSNMPAVLDRFRAMAAARGKAEAFDVSKLPTGLLEANREAIDAVLDTVEAHEDGAAGWLLAHGLTDAELAALRDRLTN